MSIASELTALNGYILDAYDEINTRGGTVPTNKNMANLVSAIASIPKRKSLPEEYTEVEWLQSDKNSYLITGITPQDNDALYAKVQCVSGSADSYRPFGAYQPGVAIDAYKGIRIWTYQSYVVGNVHLDDKNIHEISVDSAGTWSYDGTTIATERPILTAGTGRTITLFKSRYLDNTFTGTASSRIYCFTYMRSNAVIGDFVPCYRIADNEPGMYDLANKVFYTNNGSGSFTTGSAIV